jgi:DNA-binding NtrC family response regulator
MGDWQVLLVDDEPDILDSLATLLEISFPECQVRTASTGAQALKMMEAQPAHLVVSDFSMPEMNGLELLDAIKARWPESTRIILSAFGPEAMDDAMLADVANAMYSKSHAPERLMQSLARHREPVSSQG